MIAIATKKCSKCGEVKSVTDFTRNPAGSDGYYAKCRLCWNAYRRELRASKPLTGRRKISAELRKIALANQRVCPTCLQLKDVSEFGKNAGKPEERRIQCNACIRNRNLMRDFGITSADYDRMFEEQDGKCANCGSSTPGKTIKHFHVDHDHQTGRVRALLCEDCNRTGGSLGDDPNKIISLAYYFRKYQELDYVI